jgi:DNA-binding XRE family transcriptional regulator
MNEKTLTRGRESVAAFIRSQRLECGMTQQALAEKIGVSVLTIKRFESGKTWVNLKVFIAICVKLKIENFPVCTFYNMW